MIVFLLWVIDAGAKLPWRPTPAEVKRLPTFCAWRYSENPVSMKRGFSTLGEQFKNVHHFCNGLNFLSRYYRSPLGSDAKSNLANARNEFSYMVNHLVPNSSLAGHSYLYRGIANHLMGKETDALADYQKAIAYKPNLSTAYAMMADYFSKNGQRTEALKIVTEGLRYAPRSKALKRRYLSLGGKKPFPEPLKSSKTGKRKKGGKETDSKPAS